VIAVKVFDGCSRCHFLFCVVCLIMMMVMTMMRDEREAKSLR
jgi:hypothetical protein